MLSDDFTFTINPDNTTTAYYLGTVIATGATLVNAVILAERWETNRERAA